MQIPSTTSIAIAMLMLGCFNDSNDVAPAPTTNSGSTGDSSPRPTPGSEPQPEPIESSTDESSTTARPESTSTETTAPEDSEGSSGSASTASGDGHLAATELCFDEITVLTANEAIQCAQVGDVAGSDDNDVVYLLSDQVVVRVGQGNGDFSPPVFDASVPWVSRFEMADFDGDSALDLVAIDGLESLHLLFGSGFGSFISAEQHTIGADPRSLTIGDLDGNGSPDAITGSGTSGMLSIMLSTGQGGLLPPQSQLELGTVESVTVADLDTNGDLDVIHTAHSETFEGVIVWPGDGEGGLLEPTLLPTRQSELRSIVARDFNGDSRPDLAYLSWARNVLIVRWGQPRGGLGAEHTYPVDPHPFALASADLSADGRADLIVAYTDQPVVDVIVVQPESTLELGLSVTLAAAATCLATGDLNRDGVPDLAATSTEAQIVTLVLSTP